MAGCLFCNPQFCHSEERSPPEVGAATKNLAPDIAIR